MVSCHREVAEEEQLPSFSPPWNHPSFPPPQQILCCQLPTMRPALLWFLKAFLPSVGPLHLLLVALAEVG